MSTWDERVDMVEAKRKIKSLRAEVKRLEDSRPAVVEQFEIEVEALKGKLAMERHPIYCPSCQSCGEDGCCPPCKCGTVDALKAIRTKLAAVEKELALSKIDLRGAQKSLGDIFKELDEEQDKTATLEAELKEAREISQLLSEWDDCQHSEYEGDYVAEVVVTLARRVLRRTESPRSALTAARVVVKTINEYLPMTRGTMADQIPADELLAMIRSKMVKALREARASLEDGK